MSRIQSIWQAYTLALLVGLKKIKSKKIVEQRYANTCQTSFHVEEAGLWPILRKQAYYILSDSKAVLFLTVQKTDRDSWTHSVSIYIRLILVLRPRSTSISAEPWGSDSVTKNHFYGSSFAFQLDKLLGVGGDLHAVPLAFMPLPPALPPSQCSLFLFCLFPL